MEYAAAGVPTVAREEQRFLTRVFMWMFIGLGITGAIAALIGVTFAFIFELYTAQSIFTTFLIAAAMFGALAVWGALTDVDLSKLGTIAFVALFGLIIATVVNFFVASTTLYWITTYAGVLIFSALTAYDMQKLKQISERGVSGDDASRLAIFGAPPSTSTSSTSSSTCCGSSASGASPHPLRGATPRSVDLARWRSPSRSANMPNTASAPGEVRAG